MRSCVISDRLRCWFYDVLSHSLLGSVGVQNIRGDEIFPINRRHHFPHSVFDIGSCEATVSIIWIFCRPCIPFAGLRWQLVLVAKWTNGKKTDLIHDSHELSTHVLLGGDLF